MSEETKRSPLDAVMDKVMALAEPLNKFANLPAIAAVQDGLIAVMPLILIGSISLVISLLGTDSIGGVMVLPFLAPFVSQIQVINSLTMGFLGIYAAITIPASYAEKQGLDVKTASLLGLAIFFMFTLNGLNEDGSIATTAFGATGLFAIIVSSLVGVWIYQILVKADITIKMPAGVPPAVGAAFTSLIPFAIVLAICWVIRTMLDFDFVSFLTTFLTPLVGAADNIFIYTLDRTVSSLLWACGLHGDNMWTTPIFSAFQLIWTDENAAAKVAGEALPHVWTYSGIDRISTWPALVWPLIFLMIRSKVKYLRTLGWACLPAAVCTIVEPVIFGLPVALNPFLLIPFVLISVIVAVLTYGSFALGIFAKFFTTLPWATPPFILAPLGTGDIFTVAVPVIAFLIGLVIYLPFWRMFEKNLLEKQEAEEAAEKAAAEAAEA